MVNGEFEGKGIDSKEIRDMFSRDYVLNSHWYKERLKAKQEYDLSLWKKHKQYLNSFLSKEHNLSKDKQELLEEKQKEIEKRISYYQTNEYLESLIGTIGKDIL
jgi:hypothetical protein